MGILDDAIREHLDLKRRLGAEDSELARLEDEAFGPPSRPGDPDFPADKPAGETAVAEPPTGEATAQPATPPSGEPAAQAPPTEAPSEELAVEPPPAEDSTPAAPPEPPSEELPAEPVQEAAAGPESAAPATAEEPAVAEGDSGGFFDHQSDELDLDLELDLDDVGEEEEAKPAAEPPPGEVSAVPDTADQPAVDPAPAPPPAGEPPIESLDTVEHHFEGAIEDTGEAEVVEGELADEPEPEPKPNADAETDEEDEDVLEETPEFLRDAPEDDELWFEQGEPKDFDF